MNPSTELTTREQYLLRWGSLVQERSSWWAHWKEISQFLLPRSGRFFISDRNRGEKVYNNILNSTGTRANRTLGAGLMAGVTSPARPWVRLGTLDKDLMEYATVKVWLDTVTRTMLAIFAKSNTYRSLQTLYEEMGAFGTAANFVSPQFKNVINHTPITIGEYCIATDEDGMVNTLAREFEMTVGNMIRQFGFDNCSVSVQNLWQNGRGIDKWWPVIHMVEPRSDRDYTKRDNKNMPFKSCYFEKGGNEENKFLSESGFKRFPALCPRWAASGGDIYGNSPGMEALGDIKQLQHDELRNAMAVDYMVQPPLQGPTALKEQPKSSLPGGFAYYDMTSNSKVSTMFEVNLNLEHMEQRIQRVETRINATFYADLFLMLQQADTGEMTAREVAERHEEKLLMLGPVLERLHNELLAPLIDITFERMVEVGLVPPPPPELDGKELNVEFISILAQAQRAVGISAVDRMLGTVSSIVQMQLQAGMPPNALDKIDTDQTIDSYAEMIGIDPNLIVSDDRVAFIRQGRAQQQAAQQKMAAAQQMAETAKTASEADTSGKNALTDIAGSGGASQLSGYSIPGVL